MTPIRPGDIVALKTTGEPAFVLELADEKTAKIRRPVNAQDGVLHKVEHFLLDELETPEAHFRREIEQMELKDALLSEARARRQNQVVLAEASIQ